jgi:hypothetical protein
MHMYLLALCKVSQEHVGFTTSFLGRSLLALLTLLDDLKSSQISFTVIFGAFCSSQSIFIRDTLIHILLHMGVYVHVHNSMSQLETV